MGYGHSVAPHVGVEQKYTYLGITQRNWLDRMGEHLNGIRNGERKKFYNAWRAFTGWNTLLFTSELIAVNHTYQEIMAWEETYVDQQMLAGTSLNMIPGGFKGIRELHIHRINAGRTVGSKNKAVKAFERANPQGGIPNPLLSKLWDDDYAAKMICNTKLGRI